MFDPFGVMYTSRFATTRWVTAIPGTGFRHSLPE